MLRFLVLVKMLSVDICPGAISRLHAAQYKPSCCIKCWCMLGGDNDIIPQ